jgi:hypothetical protein
VVSVTDPYGRILGFLYRSPCFLFQVAPQFYLRGRMDPVPDLRLTKSGRAGNRTLTSGSVARKSDHQTTEAVIGSLYLKVKRRVLLGSVNFSYVYLFA